ncbi:hypothetical protein C8J57DRAFT_1605563 [Mycena rebaudengoi]|nr:hypothetical protein C8J57DRAFT_1605563 [Mycena rebaudengoi]
MSKSRSKSKAPHDITNTATPTEPTGPIPSESILLNDTHIISELWEKDTEINDISNKLDLQLYENFQIHAELSHEIADLDNELRQRDFLIFQLTRSLAASQKKNSSLIIQLHLACQQSTNNYPSAQALAHLREFDHLVAEEKLLRPEQENDHHQTSIMAVEGEKTVVVEITKLQSNGETLRKKTRALQMRSLRASTMTANAVSRAKTKVAVFKITSGGKYTPQVLLSAATRNLEYMVRHVIVKAPTYTDDSASIPRVRLLLVDSDTDHTSETQVKGWVDTITSYSDVFARCPPLCQLDVKFSLVTFFSKLIAMQADHAADGKKSYRLMGELKRELGLLDFGVRQLLEEPEQLEAILAKANQGKIADAGGPEAWEALSREEKRNLNIQTMKELKLALGQDVYDAMSEEEQRKFDMLVWAGCCMHKDLNATRAGAEGMKAWWKDNPHLQGPILLTTRDNAATLADSPTIPAETNPSQRRALAATECGGVKTTLLAGALFNHANDKKGLQDTHVIFFKRIKPGHSKELIARLPEYITLLEQVRDKKEKMAFNHLEGNLYKALHDLPTLTELCAMVLYGVTVSFPYASHHVQSIIDDPDILFGHNISLESAILEGKSCVRLDAVEGVRKLAPALPHLRDVTIAYFKSTVPAWERFTSEFEEGGMIDGMSDEEKADARNNTQAFMDAMFVSDHHDFIMHEYRRIDSSGIVKKKAEELRIHDTKVATEKRAKKQILKKKRNDLAAHAASITIVTDKVLLAEYSKVQLEDQLADHRQFDTSVPKLIPAKSNLKNNTKRLECLLKAVDRYIGSQDEVSG